MISNIFTCECDACKEEMTCNEDANALTHSHTLSLPVGTYQDKVEGTKVKYVHLDLCSKCMMQWLAILGEAFHKHGRAYHSTLLSPTSPMLKAYALASIIRECGK